MIIKIFSSSSVEQSVKKLFKHVPDCWYDSYIDSEGICQPFIESSKREACDDAIKDFKIWWKVCGPTRLDAYKECYSIVIYFNPNDREISRIEQIELIKDWISGMGLKPDDIFFISYLGNESIPKPIHMVLSRANIKRGPLLKLNKWKNVFVAREIEKKYNLIPTESCL